MTNIENLKYFFGAYRGICILTIYGIASVKSLGAMTEISEKLSKEKSKNSIRIVQITGLLSLYDVKDNILILS